MRNVFLLHGMKRSGNHAVANWLTAGSNLAFFNNVIPIAAILKGDRPMPAPVKLGTWVNGRTRIPYWNTVRLWKRDVLFSLEDHALRVTPFSDFSGSGRNILLVRDPYNLFASRIRKSSLVDNPAYATGPGEMFDRAIGVWKQHAREFLGDTALLSAKTCIYFNQWFVSEQYRQNIAAELDLQVSDVGLSRVSGDGGGSSFDRLSHQDNARQMDVLNRTSALKPHENEVLEIINADQEIRILNDRILRVVS